MRFAILKVFLVLFYFTCFCAPLSAQTNKATSKVIHDYIKDGKYMQAYKLAERIADKAYVESGQQSMDYCLAICDLALAAEKIGVPEKSAELYLEAVRIIYNYLDYTDPLLNKAANELARIYKKLKNYQKAAEMYEVMLILGEGIWTDTDTTYISTLLKLGHTYDVLGRYKQADSIYNIAIPLQKKVLGEWNPAYAISLMNAAALYDNMGQYAKSEEYYKQVIAIQRKKPGTKSADYAQTLNNLAFLYCHKGNYALSESTYLEAIELRKKILGENHYLYASSLNNLGGLYQITGDYAKAEKLFTQAAEIRKKALGEEDELYGGSLNNLATLYYLMGDFEKAIPLYIQTLQIYKATIGENSYEYANVLNNIANTYRQTGGSFEETENILKEALEIQKKIYGDTSLQYGSYLMNLAMVYAKKRYNFKAMPLLLQTLEIQKKTIGENHPDYATTIDNLGAVQFGMMNYDKAKNYYAQALDIRKKTLGETHPSYAISLNNMGSICYFLNDYNQAETYFAQSKKIVLENLDKNFAFLSETEKEKYTATISNEFKQFQNFYYDYNRLKPNLASEAFDIELATKGMILNSGVKMRQTILQSENSEALKIYDDWVAVKSGIAKQFSLPISERSLDVALEEEKANILEKQLTRLSSSFKEAESLLGIKWQDIQKKLGPNEVAIEFTYFRCNDKQKWLDSTMYVALVIKAGDKEPKMIPLCEAEQLNDLLKKEGNTEAQFIANLYRGSNLVNDVNTFSLSKQLYDLIWKPIENELKAGNTIYFTPAGVLHQIAFAALPYNDTTLLSDRYQLHQVSTTSMLLKESKYKDLLPPTITIYGGIDYNITNPTDLKSKDNPDYFSRPLPDDLEKKQSSWTYLPGSLTEANSIESIAKAKKIKVDLLWGPKALEETYKNLSGKNAPRVLHISSHGFFFPDPVIEKRKKENVGQSYNDVFKTSDNPLNRAGLLFAGANLAWQGNANKNAEDGILTAYEAANVSLINTQLVVLSACETGLGDIKGSEGVFGLQRAFKMAGAEYLIMSLWKVPDDETAEFMTQFYTHWFEGKTISAAFIQTQNFMKTKYPKEPYKWAAFVLVR